MNLCTFSKGDSCAVLKREDCCGCSFFKTDSQLALGRDRARALLEALPVDQQVRIKNKYGGRAGKEDADSEQREAD